MIGFRTPFFSGVLVIVIFSVNLGWLPSICLFFPAGSWWDTFKLYGR
jgi:peptide/nickel transport system permease protein